METRSLVIENTQINDASKCFVIAEIGHNGELYTLPDPSKREFSNKVLNTLNNLRYGRSADEFGWNYMVG